MTSEDDDGLVIVDYKIDSSRNASDLDVKVERYRFQLEAYARAVRDAVNRDVAGAAVVPLPRRSGRAQG